MNSLTNLSDTYVSFCNGSQKSVRDTKEYLTHKTREIWTTCEKPLLVTWRIFLGCQLLRHT